MKRLKDATDDPLTLVDRLNGVYPTASPPYKTPLIQQEAAREIERLRTDIIKLEAGYDAALRQRDTLQDEADRLREELRLEKGYTLTWRNKDDGLAEG